MNDQSDLSILCGSGGYLFLSFAVVLYGCVEWSMMTLKYWE